MSQARRIEAAREALLDAALDDEAWPRALDAVARACGGHCGQLIALDPSGRVSTHWLTGAPEDFAARIEAYGLANARVNPRLRIGRNAAELAVVADQDHVDAETRRRHPIYAEMFEPSEVDFNCQTVLDRGPGGLVRLSVSRSGRHGPMDPADLSAFRVLAPHVQSAMRIRRAVDAAALDASLRTLTALSEAAFMLDASGHVIGMTARAEALVSEGVSITLRERRLLARRPDDQIALEGAVGGTCGGECGRRLTIGDGVADVLTLEVQPLGPGGMALGPRAAALVVVHRGADRPPDRRQTSRRRWGLTDAEASVALALCDGLSSGQIATARGVSNETVRSQLQSIYLKMGVRRQAEVVARIAASG